MSQLTDNINYLMQKRGIENPTQLAAAVQMTQPTIYRILTGESADPRTATLQPIADYFGITVEGLRSLDLEGSEILLNRTVEQGPPPDLEAQLLGERISDKYVMIPRLNLLVAAGNGKEPEHVEVRDTLAFRREWLTKKGLNPDHLELYEASGDSMAPSLENGDVLLVDTSAENPRSNEVWVIWQGPPLGVRVKRLLYRENGDIIIRSDNPDKGQYPDEIVTGHNGDQVKTVGKVVWRGG